MEPCIVGPVVVARATFHRILAYILSERAAGRQLRIGFCNIHMASLAFRDAAYQKTLSQLLLLNDGVGMDLVARLLDGRPFPENLNGTDFVPRLLGELKHSQRIFLLGGAEGVAELAAHGWQAAYPHHRIVGFHHGFFTADAEAGIVRLINTAETDILLVAMGNPRQEIFIIDHAESLRCSLLVGVGALFDFAAGRVARAPPVVRAMRLEWLFRVAQEPRRLWARYTVEVMTFLMAIIVLRLRGRRTI